MFDLKKTAIKIIYSINKKKKGSEDGIYSICAKCKERLSNF